MSGRKNGRLVTQMQNSIGSKAGGQVPDLKLQSKAVRACQKPLQCPPNCLTARLCSSPSAVQEVSIMAPATSQATPKSLRFKYCARRKMTCQDEATNCTGKTKRQRQVRVCGASGLHAYGNAHACCSITTNQMQNAELLPPCHTASCACVQL